MFHFKHTNPTELLKYFKTLESIVNDINFKLTKEGIYIKGMDSSHVSLIDCFIDCDDFDEYNYTFKTDNTFIGVNLSTLCKILSASEKVDTVYFNLSNNLIDVLKITFDNSSRKSEFELKLLDLNTDEIEVQDMDYQVEIEMCIKRFMKLLSDVNIVGCDNIEFETNSKNKEIIVKGDGDIGLVKTKLKENTKNKKKLKIKKKCQDGSTEINSVEIPNEYNIYPFNTDLNMEFSIKSIESILKISSIVKRLQINLSEDTPLKMEFETSNNSYIHYYIAPKINEY